MKRVETIGMLRFQIKKWKSEGKSIALVPTMGFFHDGHLSLMREAQRHCDKTVVSIFVNPRQFGPQEDLELYPRDMQRDMQLAQETGVDLLFTPTVEEMYPPGYQTNVSLNKISKGLCGTSRPGHFDGVATVVSKLFNLIQPDIAVFGEKDYQQLALLRQMASDLNFDITLLGHPIVREQDGLAMSSRNKNLSPENRKNAVCLYNALQYSKKRVAEQPGLAVKQLHRELESLFKEVKGCTVDYISIVDPSTLTEKECAEKGDILALAAFFDGKVRLIDNTTL